MRVSLSMPLPVPAPGGLAIYYRVKSNHLIFTKNRMKEALVRKLSLYGGGQGLGLCDSHSVLYAIDIVLLGPPPIPKVSIPTSGLGLKQ